MATIINKHYHYLFLVAALFSLSTSGYSSKGRSFTRKDFPDEFLFGAGSAAYQYEGAAYEDGKGPSIWDTMTKLQPEKVSDYSNGNVANDFYHRYKDDVKLMKDMGLDSFRFSISWARVLPKGKVSGGVNQRGIKFYNDLINELLANGIKPFVTLLHYDVPQALEDEYKGVLHPKFVDDFKDYADLCFKEFGDRVKYWITMNEPNGMAMNAYTVGINAPNRCSSYMGNCTAGNSGTEPYIVTHHMLLAHAAAVKLYRHKYKKSQKGQISITIVTHWFIPYENTPADKKAAFRFLDFFLGWYLDPIVFGDYPTSMRSIVGERLPKFTKEQSEMLKGSYDFLAINYYSTYYAANSVDDNSSTNGNLSYTTDMRATSYTKKNGVYLGKPTFLSWLYIYPKGIKDLMLYVKTKYNNQPVIITENGMADDSSLPLKQALNDTERVSYHSSHLSYLLQAIKMGVNVKGYYAWTFMDDFEWTAGYTIRFGLHYVDYKNGLKRYQKRSAKWFKSFLAK